MAEQWRIFGGRNDDEADDSDGDAKSQQMLLW